MSKFKNVTVVQNANIYFDGKVTSRTIFFPDGTNKTLGIMLPGEYEFNTDAPEIIEIYTGNLEVSLPDDEGWRTIQGGDFSRFPGNPNSLSG